MSFQNKQKLLLISSFLLGLAIFVWLGKIIGWEEIGDAFAVFKGWQGLVIIAFSFLIALIGNWRWKEILKVSNIEVSFIQLFKIYLGGYAMMYLFPILLWGGEAFRVYGLMKRRSFPGRRLSLR